MYLYSMPKEQPQYLHKQLDFRPVVRQRKNLVALMIEGKAKVL
jgi:hypothetical protein